MLIALKMIEAQKLPPQVYFARNEAAVILKQKGRQTNMKNPDVMFVADALVLALSTQN